MISFTKKAAKKIANLPYRVFLVFFLISAIVSIFALRANNEHMVKLRSAVYTADKSGVGVEQALDNLRDYVYTHMNTNLSSGGNTIKPPIQLQYTYERLVSGALAKAQVANEQIYTDAQSYCQSINQAYFGTTRVPCVQNYVSTHSPAALPKTIPPALYQFDFLSPGWSPDLAGFSLLATAFFFLLLAATLTRQLFARSRFS